MVVSDHLLVRQRELDVFGGKPKHLRDFFLELPDGGCRVELDNNGSVELEAAIVALFVLDHVPDDDPVEHLTLENRAVRLDPTCAFFLTDFDHRLKDADNALDAGRVSLAGGDQLKAACVQALNDLDALVFKFFVH